MFKVQNWQIVILYTIWMWWGGSNLAWADPLVNNFATNYHPNGEWIGKLILPTPTQIAQSKLIDWVWIEIHHAPDLQQQLTGKTVVLTWQSQSAIQADSRQVTTDIHFTPATIASQHRGNLHPHRLNGRKQVGALQSLAGARSVDDVWVKLGGVALADVGIMTIDREPIQITGTLRGLVTILGTDLNRPDTVKPESLPVACPGTQPCPSEYFRVQHYNSLSQQFDGQIETVRIPQVSATAAGLYPSTIRDLDRSPAGIQGWYIYGDITPAPQPIFTVAALEPRSLFTFTPTRTITTPADRLNYFNYQHWQATSQQKGQLSQVSFSKSTPKLGTKALLIHLFGGIGGKTADQPGVWQTVTGHFAYGMATVVQDEFTQQLQWSIDYSQIYAHNPDGIVAGKQDWATYLGNLQRGWLATRPVADLLISYPPVTEDYDFGGIKISPLTELQRQLHIFAARYRTGDGTGISSVSPATSCVQDANQALYITIQRLSENVRSQPQIQAWITNHPQSPQTRRFQELQTLGTELETALAPLRIVRQDWQQNTAKLAGISQQQFRASTNPLAGLLSWRTMLPRGAQDGIGKIFSHRGAEIWFLNTNQVGGHNPDIIPIAPTILFGQMGILAILMIRIWAGLVTIPANSIECLAVVGILGGYGIMAMCFSWKYGFLQFSRPENRQPPRAIRQEIIAICQLFLLPALVEEVLFRLLLIPHPIETPTATDLLFWSLVSLCLFIIYHPLNALTFYPAGKPTFMDWRFLTLAGCLGICCLSVYLFTGSIWSAVVIHWLAVVIWLNFLGGKQRLQISNFRVTKN